MSGGAGAQTRRNSQRTQRNGGNEYANAAERGDPLRNFQPEVIHEERGPEDAKSNGQGESAIFSEACARGGRTDTRSC